MTDTSGILRNGVTYDLYIGNGTCSQEFACMLQQFFRGDVVDISLLDSFFGKTWNPQELKLAIGKLKPNKTADGCGLVL